MKHGLPFIILVFLVVPLAFSLVLPTKDDGNFERRAKGENVGAPPAPPPPIPSAPVGKRIVDIEDIVAYCEQLPPAYQPTNECNCLYTAYEFVSYKDSVQKQREYDFWYEKLTQANNRIFSQASLDDLENTRNFCARYYGNPEKVQLTPNASSRDLVAMKPILKTLPEQKAFADAHMELFKKTDGASDLYCRAYYEMASHAYSRQAHPLAGQSVKRSYVILSHSTVCSGRIR